MKIKESDLCYSEFMQFYILEYEKSCRWCIKKGFLKGVKVKYIREEPYVIHEFEDKDGYTFYTDTTRDIIRDEASALCECNRRNGVSVEMQDFNFDGEEKTLDDKFIFVSTLEMERDRLAYENDRLARENDSLQRAIKREKIIIKELQKQYRIPRSVIDKTRNNTFGSVKYRK